MDELILSDRENEFFVFQATGYLGVVIEGGN